MAAVLKLAEYDSTITSVGLMVKLSSLVRSPVDSVIVLVAVFRIQASALLVTPIRSAYCTRSVQMLEKVAVISLARGTVNSALELPMMNRDSRFLSMLTLMSVQSRSTAPHVIGYAPPSSKFQGSVSGSVAQLAPGGGCSC